MAYFFVLTFSSSDAFHWLSAMYGLEKDKVELLHQYINVFVWQKIKVVLTFCLLFLIYLYFSDRTFFSDCKKSFCLLYDSLREEWKSIPRRENYIFTTGLCLFLGWIICYCAVTPLQLDELDSWMFFVERGPLISAAYYPSNNNHILYNILSVFWNQLLTPLWAIRMVSILSAAGILILFYFIFRKRHHELITWIGLLLLMSSAPFVWYAVQGRGYELELLGLMFILFVLSNMEHNVYTDRLLFGLNAWTAYVVPVALIPLALLNVYYVYTLYIQKKDWIKRTFSLVLYSAVFILLLYAPVWIFSGFDHLFNNPFVQRVSYSDAPAMALLVYAPQLWNFITGCEDIFGWSLLVVLLGSCMVLLIRKERAIVISLTVLLFPLALLLVYPVLLFERTWLWLVMAYIVLLMDVFSLFIRTKATMGYIFTGIIVAWIMSANGSRLYRTNQNLVENAKQISGVREYLATHFQHRKIRVCNEALYDYLRFDQLQGRGEYVLFTCAQGTFEKVDAVLDTRNHYKKGNGVLLWSNRQDVLYLPK